jgi:RimJ/RimL family protein N-acetyltransferase
VTYRFYVSDASPRAKRGSLEADYESELWKPSWRRLKPHDVGGAAFLVWWFFHQTRVFANRGYALVLIRHRGQLVHRSGVYPRYFRFPFMAPGDLQIGDTWTSPEHRGHGLATFALREAARRAALEGRRVWYVAEADNLASCRVAERAGFRLAGTGERTSPFGVRALGQYRLAIAR